MVPRAPWRIPAPSPLGLSTPPPAFLADAEHPPGLCWRLLPSVLFSPHQRLVLTPPGRVALACSPVSLLQSRAELTVLPTFACFVMVWPQGSLLRVSGVEGEVSVCVVV